MRSLADAERIRAFMRAAGASAAREGVCYNELLRDLPRIKNELGINVELASPGDFIPLPREWEERSVGVVREERLSFAHFDSYSQALSKFERGHAQDLEDVEAMQRLGLVEPARLRELFAEIEPELYRFPAIDPARFRTSVEAATAL